MKCIVKQPEPKAFMDWKGLVNDDWQPTYDDLGGEVKKTLKDSLMHEQGYICCYCERRLTEDDSHIEHFKPQSHPDTDPLDYGNMLCSCQNRLKKEEPRHCGNLKEGWFDKTLLISPLEPTCEGNFAFTGDGKIKPSLTAGIAASETIRLLGLDLPKVNDLRAKTIEPFLDESLNVDEMMRFVAGYLKIDRNGIFGEFWTTIRYLFGGDATA